MRVVVMLELLGCLATASRSFRPMVRPCSILRDRAVLERRRVDPVAEQPASRPDGDRDEDGQQKIAQQQAPAARLALSRTVAGGQLDDLSDPRAPQALVTL